MKYYSISELDLNNRGWVRTYVENVTKMVEQHGGRFLTRTNNIERIEGERRNPHVLSIIEWPSREAMRAFYDSEEYRPYRQSRLAGSTGQLVLIPGEDMSKAAESLK